MRRIRATAAIILFAAFLIGASYATTGVAAIRHHYYVGTITAITSTSLAIHSKSHSATFRFTINAQTKFLRKGQGISRSLVKLGSYVTVSYSPGPHNTMIAWHISLRK